MNEIIEKQIHQLLLDPEFEELQNKLTDEVDFMSILNVSHKELQHSNILGWLFNPNANHGLGEYFIKAFIKRCFIVNKYQPIGYNDKLLSITQFDELDLDDVIVKREYKNMDILLASEKSSFLIVIENKIFSSEGGDQLTRYRNLAEEEYKNNKHIIFVYLSLFEQSISEHEQENYLKITYEEIKLILSEVLNSSRLQLKDNIRFIIQQYLKSLQSLMNDNKELKILCKKLYRKYKPAFDEVIKYNLSSGYGKAPHNLEELILSKEDLELREKSSKTFVRFFPKFLVENEKLLHEKGFLSENETLADSWILLYEFYVGNDYINFDFKLGLSECTEARENLFNRFIKEPKLFNKVGLYKDNKLYPKWHLCFQEKILTKTKYESLFEHPDKLDEHITKNFNELMDKKIPLINQAIKEVVGIV
jgi:hypothetical protein